MGQIKDFRDVFNNELCNFHSWLTKVSNNKNLCDEICQSNVVKTHRLYNTVKHNSKIELNYTLSDFYFRQHYTNGFVQTIWN